MSMAKPEVSLIIPAFNEDKTIKALVDSVIDMGIFSEIICVNDGSSDLTSQLLHAYIPKIKVIDLPKNRGKGFALATGVESAKSDIVMFLDADILNLTKEHILSLVKPVAKKVCDYSIARFDEENEISFFYNISGQRVYNKSALLPLLQKMKKSRYGVEILLNASLKDLTVIWIRWRGVKHISKYEKSGPMNSFKEYLQEGIDIALQYSRSDKEYLDDASVLKKVKKMANFNEIAESLKNLKNAHVRDILASYFKKYSKFN
jgi:glycosyltransferase involved in cell wall biosynthesis